MQNKEMINLYYENHKNDQQVQCTQSQTARNYSSNKHPIFQDNLYDQQLQSQTYRKVQNNNINRMKSEGKYDLLKNEFKFTKTDNNYSEKPKIDQFSLLSNKTPNQENNKKNQNILTLNTFENNSKNNQKFGFQKPNGQFQQTISTQNLDNYTMKSSHQVLKENSNNFFPAQPISTTKNQNQKKQESGSNTSRKQSLNQQPHQNKMKSGSNSPSMGIKKVQYTIIQQDSNKISKFSKNNSPLQRNVSYSYPALDHLLQGGIKSNEIFEIIGYDNTGKSQLIYSILNELLRLNQQNSYIQNSSNNDIQNQNNIKQQLYQVFILDGYKQFQAQVFEEKYGVKIQDNKEFVTIMESRNPSQLLINLCIIQQKLKQQIQKQNLATIIMIDNLSQIFSGDHDFEEKKNYMQEIVKTFTQLAQEKNIPTIAVSTIKENLYLPRKYHNNYNQDNDQNGLNIIQLNKKFKIKSQLPAPWSSFVNRTLYLDRQIVKKTLDSKTSYQHYQIIDYDFIGDQDSLDLKKDKTTLYSGIINIDHQNFTVVFDTYVDAKSVGYQTDAIIGFNFNFTQNKIEYPIILTIQTANLQYLQGDGVLGLDIKDNVFQIMYEQHIISSPFFTFALKDFGQQSNLYYGETAKYLFNKSTQYQSGKSNRWYLEFNGVQLESRLHNLDAQKYILTDYSFQIALVDTGTSHILFVKKIWDKIYKIFTNDLQLCKENDQLEIPLAPNSLICSDQNDQLKKYPILHFNTNQGRISLTYKQYMNHYFSDQAQKTVFTMMMAQHPQNKKNIVGSPFFRNNYISFDPLNKKIGIQVVQEYETIDFFPYASILICIFLIKIFFVFGLIYWGILLQDSLDKYIKQQPYQELAIKV
ncbi:P-loop containing nucleoside triphosphate hydrolase [Pseudocohnilembus persalinus]|uniref:p-loop containing nucleoside triphosphate hydrolase n=1 Tax=Pseudocohnilembus persalinus TaxID=266149 RepID=A0A0V0R1M1_PSEPJ|nr:P-loop containing nucleoside triphosphate hydrolase [Pseudocohnilembus persalinus]|eukprot:KRX08419.1 P-loop containing nucleoside triphosphate hydrolase [Pseudocohnilembus persalinus]